MNKTWSEYVQGINTLYLSRKLRFDDMFFEQYQKSFMLDNEKELKILEIGCGPGALAEALHRWYPKARITAIDRDSSFIGYAREKIKGVEFIEGDATALPFEAEKRDKAVGYCFIPYDDHPWSETLILLEAVGEQPLHLIHTA